MSFPLPFPLAVFYPSTALTLAVSLLPYHRLPLSIFTAILSLPGPARPGPYLDHMLAAILWTCLTFFFAFINLKFSLSMPRRHTGGRKGIAPPIRNLGVGVSGQLQVFSSLPAGKAPRYSSNSRAGGIQTRSRLLDKTRISCCCRDSDPVSSSP